MRGLSSNVSLGGYLSFPNIFSSSSSPSFNSLNNANYLAGHTFFCDDASSHLTSIMVYMAIVGSPSYGECQLDIYECDDVNSPTGASLATTTTTSTGNYVTGAFNIFNGLDLELEVGKLYCYVLKNLNATPATNYFRIGYFGMPTIFTGHLASMEEQRISYTTSWTKSTNGAMWRLGFADGTYYGYAFSTGVSFNSSYVYTGANDVVTARFLSPSSEIVLKSMIFPLYKGGTITGGTIQMKVYVDDVLLGTSINSVNAVALTTSNTDQNFIFNNLVLPKNSNINFLPVCSDLTGTTPVINIGACMLENSAETLSMSVYFKNQTVKFTHATQSFSVVTGVGQVPYYKIPFILFCNPIEPIVSLTDIIGIVD